MKTWSVFEYARLYKGKSTSFKDGELYLSSKQFDALKTLIQSDDSDHHQLFRYGYFQRQEVLICQNYVGVICLPDGDQLEILPKISKLLSDNANLEREQGNIRSSLIKMLKATRYLPSKIANNASLDLTKMPLLDVFIQLFLDEVGHLIKKGIARSYQTQEENLPYLKGKLMVSQQIKHNSVLKHKHYLAFDEYSANRSENRLIRTALIWVSKRISNENKRLTQDYLFHFTDIPSSKNISKDLKSWQRGRHFRHYEVIRPWVEMIFNDVSPTSVAGPLNMLSMLFPMEKVFEDYVALKLKEQFPEYEIKAQVREKYLLTHKAKLKGKERNIFQLKPDLHITYQEKIIIADSKWKLLNENLENEKYHIKESDMYQMLAYNQTYQKNQVSSEIWLIYPMCETFTQPLPDFKFSNGSVIKVLPFDIDSGKLFLA